MHHQLPGCCAGLSITIQARHTLRQPHRAPRLACPGTVAAPAWASLHGVFASGFVHLTVHVFAGVLKVSGLQVCHASAKKVQ